MYFENNHILYNSIYFVCSLPLARYTEEFIYSVVLANDLVPRLGFINMEKLKTEILTAIHHTNKPKVSLMYYVKVPNKDSK